MARIDSELAALSITEPPRAGLPRRPHWAIPPAGADVDTGSFAMAAAAALGVGR